MLLNLCHTQNLTIALMKLWEALVYGSPKVAFHLYKMLEVGDGMRKDESLAIIMLKAALQAKDERVTSDKVTKLNQSLHGINHLMEDASLWTFKDFFLGV